MTDRDAHYLRHAADLSRKGMDSGAGGPFGAVVVLDGQVVGEGWNRVTSTNDPTAHAEVVAIREACAKLNRFDLRGGVLYASCEPCPMCLAASLWARLDRIVYANTRDQAADIGFDDAELYAQVALPPTARAVPCIHQPSDAALDVFKAWADKTDKIPY
ncbi:nucleoside deaminase [Aerophototrophica crusticola]|uniref:Nucleoside deaminase n=1 Tax=Aerophototrophica crusticola TaxID=1709002 RepID=A0A858R4Q1_9PROT|nr:nucleoside deaminase [Rhodospirillaceae bacterium B3]